MLNVKFIDHSQILKFIDRGGDEVYSATFGDEEKTELKLDGW